MGVNVFVLEAVIFLNQGSEYAYCDMEGSQ